jgi:hypothetical protein
MPGSEVKRSALLEGHGPGDNAYMPDVSLYAAAVAGAAAVLGAAVSPVSTAYQNARQAVRDRAERRETATRQACMDLLGSARNLRVQVADLAAYHGSEMGSRLERMRQLDADVASHADNVAMLVPVDLAESAATLAAAVDLLSASAQANVKSDLGASIRDPDFTELNACIADFSTRAVRYLRTAD